MRAVKPYHRRQDLVRLLDNGGRFWHLLCKAGDQRITTGELEAASGWSASKVAPFVFLAMKMIEMQEDDQVAVLSCLTSKLRKRYDAYQPQLLDPSDVESQAEDCHTVIISGYLRDVQGTFAVIGDVPWVHSGGRWGSVRFQYVPVGSVYRTFTLHDTSSLEAPGAAMAFRGKADLPLNQRVRFGGVLSELLPSADNVRSHRVLFRPSYYTVIGDDDRW